MCGIVGYSGSFKADALRSGRDAMLHRGPDDSGEYFDSLANVGLGHVRLSIRDLSHLGHQPMVTLNGAVALVFNGEIYNHQELRDELVAAGYVFRGHSDTEVLLNLYLAEGEAMLQRLNGIFAFAVWDQRSQTLLLARDALGVKPFYYAEVKSGLAFASELKGLLHLMPLEAELDADSLHRYVSFLWCPGEGTPIKSVRKLLPGHAMVVRAGQIERLWAWYQLPVFHTPRLPMTKSAAARDTVKYLRQAVERQMVADVPVGAFLSGGLDSSAIVAFARDHNPDIRCFSIEVQGGQDEGVTDDLPYARRVAKHLGVPLDVVVVDAHRMATDLQKMVIQLDEPLADPAALNVLYISQLAREQGMKVLLSGTAGDDLFTGYRRHRAVQFERSWRWLPQPLRSFAKHASAGLDQRRPLSRKITKLLSGAAFDGDERLVEYFRWTGEPDLMALYSPEFRARLGDTRAATPMLDFLKPLSKECTPLERMLALEQRFFLADHNLTYTDKMSMAAGVEVRVPFLDLDLVNFAASIPIRLKQHGSQGKWILKKAMEPYLPHEVIYRPKSGFGVPLRRWMRHDLRELLGDLLSVNSLTRRGIFDARSVQHLIKANNMGEIDASYTLLSILCIEVWCRNYLDKSSGALQV
jgi:asparagine synthase (glutamine-hydrolysing)